MEHKKLIVFLILSVVFIALAVQATFFQAPLCQTFECFEDKMRECDSANYLNDDSQATWRYKILGIEDGACVVEVTLLQPKSEELSVERLAGYSMQCGFPKGVVVYPEKDLASCHGRLKEEMQAIIIERLHTYIVDNLGQIDQTLDLVVE